MSDKNDHDQIDDMNLDDETMNWDDDFDSEADVEGVEGHDSTDEMDEFDLSDDDIEVSDEEDSFDEESEDSDESPDDDVDWDESDDEDGDDEDDEDEDESASEEAPKAKSGLVNKIILGVGAAAGLGVAGYFGMNIFGGSTPPPRGPIAPPTIPVPVPPVAEESNEIKPAPAPTVATPSMTPKAVTPVAAPAVVTSPVVDAPKSDDFEALEKTVAEHTEKVSENEMRIMKLEGRDDHADEVKALMETVASLKSMVSNLEADLADARNSFATSESVTNLRNDYVEILDYADENGKKISNNGHKIDWLVETKADRYPGQTSGEQAQVNPELKRAPGYSIVAASPMGDSTIVVNHKGDLMVVHPESGLKIDGEFRNWVSSAHMGYHVEFEGGYFIDYQRDAIAKTEVSMMDKLPKKEAKEITSKPVERTAYSGLDLAMIIDDREFMLVDSTGTFVKAKVGQMIRDYESLGTVRGVVIDRSGAEAVAMVLIGDEHFVMSK